MDELDTVTPADTTCLAAADASANEASADEATSDDAPATEVVTAKPATPSLRFDELDLPDSLQRAIADIGFSHCTPIQANILEWTLNGADAIGKAQTGTGKTAAFLITVITDLLRRPLPGSERHFGEPRALVIAPTRELVLQIAKDAEELARHSGLRVASVVGGMDYEKQQKLLHTEHIDILVATPGRLLDFENRRDLYLGNVEALVIDEADRMLDMGFIPDVKRIVRLTPQKKFRQTLLFSATFPFDVINLSRSWTLDPVVVEIEPERVTTDSVEQIVYITTRREKLPLLYNLVTTHDLQRVMVFANRRDEARRLTDELLVRGINAALLSGDVPQQKRIRTLENFREGKIRVLVATDVAGRGIHIEGISHVVNYTLPEQVDDYVHRIGRTGRAGANGTSVSFACEDDAFMVPVIEEAIGLKLPCTQPEEALLTELPAPSVVLAEREGDAASRHHNRRNQQRRRH